MEFNSKFPSPTACLPRPLINPELGSGGVGVIGVLYWTGLHLKTVIYLKALRSDQDVSRVYENQIQQSEVKGTA